MTEVDLVELVAADGSPVGSSTVVDAHTAPGRLHRAFSVLLFDPSQRTLLQRRARVKTRFPLIWANSCCGHPRPGESAVLAGRRRLTEELGVHDVDLTEVGVHVYAAADPETGRVEREYDHVLIGRVEAGLALAPDPDEVAATRWEPATELLAHLTSADTIGYAPWLAGVLAIACRSA